MERIRLRERNHFTGTTRSDIKLGLAFDEKTKLGACVSCKSCGSSLLWTAKDFFKRF